jgi:hypothetical protein
MICIVHSINRSLTHRLVKLLYFEDEISALSESIVAFPLIAIVSYFYTRMDIEEKEFIEKIAEFYHDNMRVWVEAVLDLYGNVISKTNNPVSQIQIDEWRILVTKQYKDLSEGEKEFYRAKTRWLWYKNFKAHQSS